MTSILDAYYASIAAPPQPTGPLHGLKFSGSQRINSWTDPQSFTVTGYTPAPGDQIVVAYTASGSGIIGFTSGPANSLRYNALNSPTTGLLIGYGSIASNIFQLNFGGANPSGVDMVWGIFGNCRDASDPVGTQHITGSNANGTSVGSNVNVAALGQLVVASFGAGGNGAWSTPANTYGNPWLLVGSSNAGWSTFLFYQPSTGGTGLFNCSSNYGGVSTSLGTACASLTTYP